MKAFVSALALVLLPAIASAAAAPPLDWAYPVAPPAAAAAPDYDLLIGAPGSTKRYSRTQIDDAFSPPDWFPNEHPAMPQVVAHGRKPDGRACALCHLPSGSGHPESANLSGINPVYFARQMADFRAGLRKGVRADAMATIARGISDADIKAAGDYFAGLKPVPWTKVVESATVAKSFLVGTMRFPLPKGGKEPIGQRIIELPVNDAGAQNRDPHFGFVAYVPPGSIKKGEALVATGGGKTVQCATCHGPDLKGVGEVPLIAGHSTIYIFRQLHDFQTGMRAGASAALMKPVVAKLDTDDMIAIAAYVASRAP